MKSTPGHAAARRFIPFNKPFIAGRELYYIAEAVAKGQLAGDGEFTRRCSRELEKKFGAAKILLTHSGTAALEMAALLCDIKPGDEFIVPSYTFVSTANAFVLRGGVPVFADIRPDTLNIDERKIERLITPRTRVIVPVHYAGVSCDMDAIMAIARKHRLLVVEDAAHGICARSGNRYLGTIGDLGCYSFHETKNFISGEGGAISVNNQAMIERAEIIREKGTNRAQFFRGMVDKYTWVDLGSSYLPGELIAAFLAAQLEEADRITRRRLSIWNAYHKLLAPLEQAGLLRRPVVSANSRHNGHMYYLLLASLDERTRFIRFLREHAIEAVFHYVPLHTSPMGRRFAAAPPSLPVTEDVADRLVRLPCFYELGRAEIARICRTAAAFFAQEGRGVSA